MIGNNVYTKHDFIGYWTRIITLVEPPLDCGTLVRMAVSRQDRIVHDVTRDGTDEILREPLRTAHFDFHETIVRSNKQVRMSFETPGRIYIFLMDKQHATC